MKKLTASLFVLVLILVLAGCTLKQPQETTLPSRTTAAPTEAGCNHTYAAATCTAPKTCTSCGATEGEAKGHTPVTDPAVAASCITTGKTEGSHCSTCNAVLSEQAFLPANGHTFVDGKCSICDSLEPSEGLVLTLDESGEYYIVTAPGACEDMDIIIPNVYNGLPVRAIGANCFEGRTWFNSVTIQKGVTQIGEAAFRECSGMTSVVIPEGVTAIRESTFERCYKLSSVELPDSMLRIGKSAFEYCHRLTSIDLKRVRNIGERAFHACGFTSLDLPDSLYIIGADAFSSCNKLTALVIPGSITSIGKGAISFCWELTSVVISEGVSSISPAMFAYCQKLTSIEIPSSVTSAGSFVFQACDSLTSVVIAEGVTSIGDGFFDGCDSLTYIAIPASMTALGKGAFSYCTGLTRINFAGTMAQWQDIEPYNKSWKDNSNVTEVICTDGSIQY